MIIDMYLENDGKLFAVLKDLEKAYRMSLIYIWYEITSTRRDQVILHLCESLCAQKWGGE